MRKWLLSDLAVAVAVSCMTGWGVASYSASARQSTSLPELRGAASCDKCSCAPDNKHSFECTHTSMDPAAQTCSTTTCNENWVFFAACTPKDKGVACPLGTNGGAAAVVQNIQDGAPAACNGVNQAVNT